MTKAEIEELMVELVSCAENIAEAYERGAHAPEERRRIDEIKALILALAEESDDG